MLRESLIDIKAGKDFGVIVGGKRLQVASSRLIDLQTDACVALTNIALSFVLLVHAFTDVHKKHDDQV